MAARTTHAKVSGSVKVPFGSLTGSLSTFLTFTDDVFLMFIQNKFDEDIVVSVDGGSSSFDLLSGLSVTFDFQTNTFRLPNPEIQFAHAGVAPTTGSVAVLGFTDTTGD